MGRRRVVPIVASVFSIWCGVLFSQTAHAGNGSEIADAIEMILQQPRVSDGLWVGCEQIHAGRDLIGFYAGRQNAPVWVGMDGPFPGASTFARTLAAVDRHGLRPEDYHFDCLRAWLQLPRPGSGGPVGVKALAGLDIVLTDAFMIFASHLSAGRIDPERLYPQWLATRRKADILAVLTDFSEHGQVARVLEKLAPPHPGYRRLLEAAGRMRTLAEGGGWPAIPPGPSLRKNDAGPRVGALHRRLAVSGDLAPDPPGDVQRFDGRLEAAVRRFQGRHGLDADGVVGRQTLLALNVTARDRWQQMMLNLERWRWLPQDLGRRRILVNTAAFKLDAFDGTDRVLSLPVIVGKAYQKTPVFSRDMQYLEINPYWNVPRSIVRNELLPAIRKDPDFLKRNHFELLSGWEDGARVIDPATIDWDKVHSSNFPGRLRQLPGPWNSLGYLKFMFPNRFSVYLHDTPHRGLFRQPRRALSHGCIRVGRPVDLALFLLEDQPGWTRERIGQQIQSGQRQVLGIRRSCRVHLLYWTAWVAEDGTCHFREDVYHRDGVLWDALNRPQEG